VKAVQGEMTCAMAEGSEGLPIAERGSLSRKPARERPRRAMTLQELLLKGLSDKEDARLQSLEIIFCWKFTHESNPVRTFQNSSVPGEREIPAQGNSPSNCSSIKSTSACVYA